jgi:diguanylate cyclase (GGDEF)-like protein
MRLLVISRHESLVERLRMAFEGAGHQVEHISDPLQALAQEAWSQAQLLLIDAEGDPMDGYRFSRLMRAESRVFFQSLPIFLISDEEASEDMLRRAQKAGSDGFVLRDQNIQELLNRLGPVLEGLNRHADAPPVPVLGLGLRKDQIRRIQEAISHFRFELHTPPSKEFMRLQEELKAPLLLMGLDHKGEKALVKLELLRDIGALPYTILFGQVDNEAMQRKLLLAGASDWIHGPISVPRLLHACRRGLEWVRVKRIQAEFEAAVNDLRERRTMLEIEAASLRTEVLTDPLTELLNRRAFDQNLEHALRQWERNGRSFTLILGDIDHFKLINDRFGHPVGDEVLKQMAERIRLSLRRSDLAFRIGGEEFAMLLPETSLRAGAEVAEKLRKRIDGDPIRLSTGQSILPSMSFGVGIPDQQHQEDFISAVDRALYRAKASGRNRVILAGEQGFEPQAMNA